MAGAITAVLGGTLVYLAGPVVVSSILAMSGNPVLRQIRTEGTFDESLLNSLIDSRRSALSWHETGQLWAELGLAHLLAADQPGAARQQHLQQAEDALTRGVALAPANSDAWTRLAYARLLMDGPSLAVTKALRMAILTGPYEPGLALIRLELALRVWSLVPPIDRDLVAQQVRFAWELDPDRVVELTRATGRATQVRDALRTTPGALERLDELEQRSDRDRESGMGQAPG